MGRITSRWPRSPERKNASRVIPFSATEPGPQLQTIEPNHLRHPRNLTRQGRAVSPSCNARRMVATAAHLTDHVLPALPVRQWVLAAVPAPGGVLPARAQRSFGPRGAYGRGGLHPPLWLDAQCGPARPLRGHRRRVRAGVGGGGVFHAATGLETHAIARAQAQVRRRLLPDDAAQAMAHSEHGGGFSVHASVRIEAANRSGRERLLRYCGQFLFALDRPHERDPEHLLHDSAKPGSCGNGPLLLTPLQLLDRLAALMPPPHIHRHRDFGLLAQTAAHGRSPRRLQTAGVGRLREVANGRFMALQFEKSGFGWLAALEKVT